jgi:hypothetical protein
VDSIFTPEAGNDLDLVTCKHYFDYVVQDFQG